MWKAVFSSLKKGTIQQKQHKKNLGRSFKAAAAEFGRGCQKILIHSTHFQNKYNRKIKPQPRLPLTQQYNKKKYTIGRPCYKDNQKV